MALSRQIGIFHPKLEGLGIGHRLPSLQFPDILADKLRVMWEQEALPTDAQQCWWGLMVILNMVPFADPLWEFERGPHLLCQCFVVIYSRDLSQFLPPVMDCHAPRLSRSPNSLNPPQGVLGRTSSYPSPPSNQPATEGSG